MDIQSNNRQEAVQAARRAMARLGFYFHLNLFVVFNLLFLFLNLMIFSDNIWFFWPMLGGGVCLILHFLAVFFLPIIRNYRSTCRKKRSCYSIRKGMCLS